MKRLDGGILLRSSAVFLDRRILLVLICFLSGGYEELNEFDLHGSLQQIHKGGIVQPMGILENTTTAKNTTTQSSKTLVRANDILKNKDYTDTVQYATLTFYPLKFKRALQTNWHYGKLVFNIFVRCTVIVIFFTIRFIVYLPNKIIFICAQ